MKCDKPHSMALSQWLEKISQIHPVKWDLGLSRVAEVGKRLGVKKPAKTVFLVAGTNGKGSTCEYLAQLCRALKLSHGKTTSPYLLDYNEQIMVDGEMAGDQAIIDAFVRIDGARGETSLTYFEFGALAALDIFTRRDLDVAIVEVGLGGRLDAMNIVEADVSIITRIALDHQEWLGDDRVAIAREKAGILRSGKPCIFVDPEPPASLFSEAESVGAVSHCVGRDFHVLDDVLRFDNLDYVLGEGELPQPSLVAAICGMLAAGFDLTQHIIDVAIENSRLPGRFQMIGRSGLPGEVRTILDVAHNPNAALYLLEKLRKKSITKVQAVVGMYADKDVEKVFQLLTPVISGWHLCGLDVDRAASPAELSRRLSVSCGLNGNTYDKVTSAYEAASAACRPDEIVLVFGSFAVVGAVLRHLE